MSEALESTIFMDGLPPELMAEVVAILASKQLDKYQQRHYLALLETARFRRNG